jgi:membrane-associated protein
MSNLLNPDHILETWGLIGLIVVVFAESGLLIGFFLPGDSLLVTAGILAAAGEMNIVGVSVGCAVAAVVGDQVGYAVGAAAGPRIFETDRRFLKRKHIDKAEEFFAHHGGKSIFLARFVPIVRTLTPTLAGAVKMDRRTFTMWNVGGGIVWGGGLTLAGFALGSTIEDIDKYLLPVIAVVVALSFLPVLFEIRRHRRNPIDPDAVTIDDVAAAVGTDPSALDD